MTSKASILRSYINIDNDEWTCNLCFKDRIGKPDLEMKPLKAYSFKGTSNIERHFIKFHNEVYNQDLSKLKSLKMEEKLKRKVRHAKMRLKVVVSSILFSILSG